MRTSVNLHHVLPIAMALLISVFNGIGAEAQARFIGVPRSGVLRTHQTVHTTRKPHSRTRGHHVTQYAGARRSVIDVTSHHGRHHRYGRRVHSAPKVRHAYPLNFFMLNAPDFDRSPLPADGSRAIQRAFDNGTADGYPARMLVRAGIAHYHPLHGGIFWRREPVKYIIMHSTESGVPQDAPRVINSWSSLGRRHAGAQFVVDRDGTIYMAVDPDLSTVHVNIFKTLPGINNDNTIGIEMCHAGRQTYTSEQLSSVIRLVAFLQGRYQVADENIITHRYAQQGDHTDPVAFDWEGFLRNKDHFRTLAMGKHMEQMAADAEKTWISEWPLASTYLQIHGKLATPASAKVSAVISPAPPAVQEPDTPESPDQAPAQAKSPPQERAIPLATVKPAAATAGGPSSSTGKTLPSLRGPIEIDPKAASVLNSSAARAGTDGQPASRPVVKPAAAVKSSPSGAEFEMFVH